MRSGQTVRLDFDSTFEMLDLVQVVSDHIARLAGLDEEARPWVNVAVRESVINAIKDVAKRVHVEFTPIEPVDTPSGVMIRVRDEGHGFDPASVPDPLAPENLLKGSGRGIFLIRSFMDEMILQRAAEGGMEMVMVKRASPMQDPGYLSA